MLHKLRQLGHRAIVLEAGSGVGGTWFWNRYPGARCDVASMEYSYQFDDQLQQQWNWSERYSPQPEILKYANHVADRFDLRKDIQFNTRVVAADYDENKHSWKVTTDDGAARVATYLIAATGCLSNPNQPKFEGLDRFKGRVYHTGKWPTESVNFSDKKVAVIGTGSSAIQAIPVIAKQAKQLTVFQRTANYAVPAYNRPMEQTEREQIKANYPQLRALAAQHRNGQAPVPNLQSALEVSALERNRIYEQRWRQGGLAFMGSFGDLIFNEESNKTAADFVRSKIAQIVNDPETARILSPTTKIGCKRLCVDTGYYHAFNKDHVSIVDINAQPIEAITQSGIAYAGKQSQFDAIILATGYDAMTGSLLKMNIRGRDHTSLSEAWREGPKTYMGLACNGFPNLFTITGPGSPSVLTNMLPSIEQHVNFVSDILAYANKNETTVIEAELNAQLDWAAHVNSIAENTIYPGCNSWYLGANVPGKPRVFMPYIGFADYVKKCQEVAADHFQGFTFK